MMRRFALLGASLLAVLVLGGLAVWAQVSAARQVNRVHTADRATLQQTLAGLTDQYLQFTVLATNTAANDRSWNLATNSPADRAALQGLVRSSPLTSYAAVTTSLTGAPLTAYPSGSALPSASDPGFSALRRGLLAGRAGVSDVMSVHGTPVVAFAVPITRGAHPVGLLVTFANLRTWPLESYDGKLQIGPHADSYVVDSAGVIAAARDERLIGKPLRTLPPRATDGGAGMATVRANGTSSVVSYGPAGNGWTAVTVQPESAFSGRLTHSRDLAFLALALLLSFAVLLLLMLHHKRQQALARLAEERLYDPLTGLGQRGVFEMRVNSALARHRRNPRPMAVLFCDLDDFKDVNDRYGHNVGDQLLVAVSRRICQAVRETDMVARLGGDEFAIVMEETSEEETRRIATRLRALVGQPLDLNGRQLAPCISVGGAVLNKGTYDLTAILHEADMAMYTAKREGLGCVVTTSMDKSPSVHAGLDVGN